MKTRTDNPLNIDKPSAALALATVCEHSPALLTEVELDHVAAAGAKPGIWGAGGADGIPPHRPK